MAIDAFLRIPPQVTTFLSGAGTYTIPVGATVLRVQLQGGGTGGGSGRRGAAGTARGGGGAGATGAYTEVTLSVAELLASLGSNTLFYSVGTGTAGGAAQTANDSNGIGASGPTTANHSWIGKTNSVNGILYGIARTAVSSGQGGTTAVGSSGAGATGSTPAPANSLSLSGVGGSITAGDVASNGNNGAANLWSGQGAGNGGIVDSTLPTSGTASGILSPGPAPGGGAASITTAAQAGANALDNSGAGGGGGGASLNGNNSGAGGNGGSGYIRITAFF